MHDVPRYSPSATRRLLVLGGLAAAVPALANPEARSFDDLIAEADRLLAQGFAARAATAYEEAARVGGEHVEAELSASRAHAAAGEFRRALAYAQLTAGEHPESHAALAWLAYLQDRCGYVEVAVKALRAVARPGIPSLAPRAALAEILLERGQAQAAVELLKGSGLTHLWRRAQRAAGLAVSADIASPEAPEATVVWPVPGARQPLPGTIKQGRRGNGVVVGDGNLVLTTVVVEHGASAWVRNGLGSLRRARPLRTAGGASLLQLAQPFQIAAPRSSAPRAAFEDIRGPCFLLGFAALDADAPGYPLMTPGRVVRTLNKPITLLQLSTRIGVDQSGAPVFDAAGQLIAVGLADQELVPGITDRRAALGDGHFALGGALDALGVASGAAASASATSFQSVEELYEKLLPTVVEVWTTNA